MQMTAVKRAIILSAGLVLLLFFLLRQSPSNSAEYRTRLREQAAEFQFLADGHNRPPPSAKDDELDTIGTRPKQVPMGEMASKSLRTRLAYFFPYDPSSKFPNYIWQTWRNLPSEKGFADDYRPMEASWTEQHPDFIHEVLTDNLALNVLRHLYSGIPEILEAYEAMPRTVLQADFFRYLILLARGGIYSDIDTFAIKPAYDWVPADVPRSSFGLVIGIEADPDREDWADWYSRRIQFCQWTIQAKPGHPVLREIVAKIAEETLVRKADGRLARNDVHDVVGFTGPAAWTDTIFEFFNDPRYFDMRNASDAGMIDWRSFTGMTEVRRVGDVVVLPITCFSPGIQTMGAGEDDDPMAFVKHYFDGSWKPESERHIGESS